MRGESLMKYYAVRKGRQEGIFTSWPECQKQVSGFKGAEFKSFKTKSEAQTYLNQTNSLQNHQQQTSMTKEDALVVYVDGSYDQRLKRYGYGGVIIYQNQETTFQGSGTEADLIVMRNVAGELLEAMRAVSIAEKIEAPSIIIYHDYAGIAKWATGDWRANKSATQYYQQFMQKHAQNLTIHFEKVAAHTGDYYNEQADQLAKEAVRNAL